MVKAPNPRACLILSLLFSFTTQAQDWAPFNFDWSYYKSMKSLNTPTPFIGFSIGEIISLSLDSCSADATGEHYFPNKLIGCEMNDPVNDCGNGFDVCSDLFSWCGSPVTRDAGVWSTVNRWDDTLEFAFPDQPNVSDTFYTQNDTFYLITMDTLLIGDVLGESDSLKVFTMKVVDSNGNVFMDYWYNHRLVLSKHHGFIECPSWYLFPYQSSLFSLVDQNGIGELGSFSFERTYDYEVGDILHYNLESENGYLEGQTEEISSLVMSRRHCTIVGIDTSAVSREYQVQVSWENRRRQYSYSYGPFQTHLLIDTFTHGDSLEIWSDSNLKATHHMKQLKHFRSAKYDGYDVLMFLPVNYSVSLVNDSLCPFRQFIFEGWGQGMSEYRLGLGLLSSSVSYLDNSPGNYYHNSNVLTYYRWRGEEHGSVGLPIGVMEERSAPSEVIIFPNPTTGLLNVESGLPIVALSVFSLQGELVLRFEPSGTKQQSVDFSHLEPGVYILTVLHNDAAQESIRVLKL